MAASGLQVSSVAGTRCTHLVAIAEHESSVPGSEALAPCSTFKSIDESGSQGHDSTLRKVYSSTNARTSRQIQPHHQTQLRKMSRHINIESVSSRRHRAAVRHRGCVNSDGACVCVCACWVWGPSGSLTLPQALDTRSTNLNPQPRFCRLAQTGPQWSMPIVAVASLVQVKPPAGLTLLRVIIFTPAEEGPA